MELNIKMYSMQGAALEGTAVTDGEGRFAFTSNADYTGDWTAVFTVRNEDGKKKWSRLAIDRWFMPPARAIEPAETDIAMPSPANEATRIDDKKIETFEWNDTIPRLVAQNLGEAVVIHKGEYRGFTGGRYSFRGGEEAGMREGIVFYDIASEVERTKDAGQWPNFFMEFFADVDSNVTPERDNDNPSLCKLRYRGREAKVMFNNNDTYNTDLDGLAISGAEPALADLMAEEVKSVAIMPRESIARYASSAFLSKLSSNANDLPDHLINIYIDPQFARFKARKGVETRRVQGYTQPRKFFSPSYNGLELPSDADRRRTLFWCPSIKTDAAGRASAVFYNNARSGTRLHITARGIAGTGQFVDFER